MYEIGSKIEFRGFTATVIGHLPGNITKIAYVDNNRNIHIVHIRSLS